MILQPTSPQGQAAAIGLLLAALAAVWIGAILPVVAAFQDQRGTIERSELLLQEYQRRLVPIDGVQAELDALKRRQAAQSGFLEGGNAAMGSAALQTAIKRTLEANGGVLRTIQVLAPTVQGSVQRVGVHIDGAIPQKGLLDFLYAVRSTSPFLFPDNLEIRVPENAAGQKAAPDAALRADVFGYIRVGAR